MTDPVCEVGEPYRSACKGETWYGTHDGKRYCVLHYPDNGKAADGDNRFHHAVNRKLQKQDFNFAVVHFPEYVEVFASLEFKGKADFSMATFEGGATFDNAVFCEHADFSDAKFAGNTSFSAAQFDETAHFKRASFRRSVSFAEAKFTGKAVFAEADLGTFPGKVSFERAYFFGTTSFNSARFSRQTTFEDATFDQQVQFIDAVFRRNAFFSRVTFKGDARFEWATFRGHVDFSRTTFDSETLFSVASFYGIASFRTATFGEDTSFSGATFGSDAYFAEADFRDRVIFLGTEENRMFAPEATVDFNLARAERPELVSFQTVTLRPSWMVGTNPRFFSFTDVTWYGFSDDLGGGFHHELDALQIRHVESRHRLLEKTFRELCANYEDKRDFPLASEFHYWSMEALRKQGWNHFGIVRSLYFVLSGYGERPQRAFWILIALFATFAGLYAVLGPDNLRVLSACNFSEGLRHAGQATVYSLSTMARLNPAPKPEPGLFQFLVSVEGILGPLQIALLALAIRRKVMR